MGRFTKKISNFYEINIWKQDILIVFFFVKKFDDILIKFR